MADPRPGRDPASKTKMAGAGGATLETDHSPPALAQMCMHTCALGHAYTGAHTHTEREHELSVSLAGCQHLVRMFPEVGVSDLEPEVRDVCL